MFTLSNRNLEERSFEEKCFRVGNCRITEAAELEVFVFCTEVSGKSERIRLALIPINVM